MSTFKYDNAALLLGTAQINLTTAVVKAMLVSAGYAPLKGTDTVVANIPSAAILVRSAALTGAAVVGGVFRGVIPQINAFAASVPAVAVILYVDTGNDNTAPLLYYSSDGIGFPFLPIGINYAVLYDQANGGWFQI